MFLSLLVTSKNLFVIILVLDCGPEDFVHHLLTLLFVQGRVLVNYIFRQLVLSKPFRRSVALWSALNRFFARVRTLVIHLFLEIDKRHENLIVLVLLEVLQLELIKDLLLDPLEEPVLRVELLVLILLVYLVYVCLVFDLRLLFVQFTRLLGHFLLIILAIWVEYHHDSDEGLEVEEFATRIGFLFQKGLLEDLLLLAKVWIV